MHNRDSLRSGVFDLHPKGYGFLRRVDNSLKRNSGDVFVPEGIVKQFRLRPGVQLTGVCNFKQSSRSQRLNKIVEIESISVQDYQLPIPFDDQIPINPCEWLRLENSSSGIAMRVIDLFCPLGVGQRALIASPPRAGKTTLLRQIGNSISQNYPKMKLVVLLVDERPEEVTDLRAEIRGEVYASCIDQDAANHVRLARLVSQRCRRLAESGEDVVLLVDSLTRIARAANKLPGLNGPIGAGGLNIRALDMPKMLFASARAFANGGSLAIVASVLTETENRMDDVIFREFKGTGNLDLVLDQNLANQRVWPALDIKKSATRRVELLHDTTTLRVVTALRNTIMQSGTGSGMKELIQKLGNFRTNEEFIEMIGRHL